MYLIFPKPVGYRMPGDRVVACKGCFCQCCYRYWLFQYSGVNLTVPHHKSKSRAHKANKCVEMQRLSSAPWWESVCPRKGGSCCFLSPRTAMLGNANDQLHLPGPPSTFPSGIFFILVERLLSACLFEELFCKVNHVL